MSPAKTVVLSKNAPAPSPLMSQAIISNGVIYTSGSLGIDPKTGKFVEGDAADRTVQALRNIEQILIAAGSNLGNALKVTIFLSSMEYYAQMNEGYERIFGDLIKPCRTCVAVAKLPLDAEVEIELVASV
ncbi:Endoribonuclease L-PSP/chorismate mutase-like protein [Aspergillus caelatus]|uniref:Endoribonuclease L-PSP/chorismate mutase-like protein n=1 Tax=Aspergillus caelatus TaxID=61420 RepID=A0A5N7AKV3_9EURO|nr:Endoribonuclease L-PSP/chorismate mutase-like protein [Aspergillus caelatus]KAE8370445.1 Endoribonuclease L-PSP/chorismate mutase-like protein [Aspergillus caelatus]